MKVFLDVDGVLIDGWHANPERRNPWDATIEQDLGINRQAFQATFFGSPAGIDKSLMHACVRGGRDLKDALADVLPNVGYVGSVDAFVAYWFEKDSNVNLDVLDAVKRLAGHTLVELYLVTGQEHYRAAYLWNNLGFCKYFRSILYSARLGHLKSTPQFFSAINAELIITPADRPVFFDDQEEIVRLAREAGWDACVFNVVEDLVEHSRLQGLLRR